MDEKKEYVKWLYDAVFIELREVMESVDKDALVKLAERIAKPGTRVLGYGAGRMGFGLKAFCMRLNHLGIPAFFFGDNYIPPIGEDDVFIACSNSGSTKSVLSVLEIARAKANPFIVTVTGNTGSPMAQKSDLVVKFKTCNGGLNSEDDPTKINSIQPMTTLTEQAMFILFDIVAMLIIRELGIDIRDTKKYHSNIE